MSARCIGGSIVSAPRTQKHPVNKNRKKVFMVSRFTLAVSFCLLRSTGEEGVTHAEE
jgi:hypothetical protein